VRRLTYLLWGLFAILLVVGGGMTLHACGGAFWDASCPLPQRNAVIDAEHARAVYLQANVHEAEIHLALLPACPRPPVSRPLPPPPQPKKDEASLPQTEEELKGCWKSARGDITLYDDHTGRPVDTARLCYCFQNNGQGIAQIRYSNGDLCNANLRARLAPNVVFMRQDLIPCRRHSDYLAHDLSCRNDANDQTVCEIISKGNLVIRRVEPFVRVQDESCGG